MDPISQASAAKNNVPPSAVVAAPRPQPEPGGPADAWLRSPEDHAPTLYVSEHCAALAPAPFIASQIALQPPALSLAFQDMVMRCIDRYAPPGYLTVSVIRDILDVPLGDAMEVFACVGDAWVKQRIKQMPEVLRALDKRSVPRKEMARQLLWAVHEDNLRRGPIWRELQRDQAQLKALEQRKKEALPWGKSSSYIRKWLGSDPDVVGLRARIEQAEQKLRQLPSSHAQQIATDASELQGPLIEL